MKKTFPLEVPSKKTARVLDSIKHEVNKYVKRERNKKLPEGMDFWDFDCRVGVNAESAVAAHIKTMSKAIDTAAEENPESIYLEIVAKAVKRNPKKEKSPRNEKPDSKA